MNENRPNPHGHDWAVIRKHSRERIETWRIELESLNVAPDRAQQLRGMIFALQEQMEFVEPPRQPEVKEPKYG